jgi:methylglyoxal synthase
MATRALEMGGCEREPLGAFSGINDLLAAAQFNRQTLTMHELFATGTTGSLIATALELPVHRFLSGQLGGDEQVGAIAEGRIDAVVFFWDPLEPHPHDVVVKARLRLAVVHNIAIACNRATADFVLSSRLMNEESEPSFTPELDAVSETQIYD